MENYKEKYEMALNKAKTLLSKCKRVSDKASMIYRAEDIENMFPEFQKPEEERIKNALIELVKCNERSGYTLLNNVSTSSMIDWLEKQGQSKKTSIWKHWKNGIAGNGEGKLIFLIKSGVTYSLSSCLSFECDYIELSELENLMVEKQDDFNSEYWRGYREGKQEVFDKYAKLEKQSKQNINPKFKTGDWIIFNGLTLYINEVAKGYYRTISKGGTPNSYDWNIDNAARLWTVEDAKEGDVLSYITDEENLWIMIYQSLYKPYENHVHYHALLINDDFTDKGTCYIDIKNLKPATTEQRELLFTRMKESNYTWDENIKRVIKYGE